MAGGDQEPDIYGPPDYGPPTEMWQHLEAALQIPLDEMRGELHPELRRFYQSMAKVVVEAQRGVLVNPRDPEFVSLVDAEFADWPDHSRKVMVKKALEYHAWGQDRWMKLAVDLENAREGVFRSSGALDRFSRLVPRLSTQAVPSRARPYVREAVATYLFGFYPASIALSRAALEQAAKDTLVRIGVYTDAYVRKSQILFETLLRDLRSRNVLQSTASAAERVQTRGNTVMHVHTYDARIQEQQALDCLADLISVLTEVLPPMAGEAT
jgi:hypothetical protein